MSPAYTVALLGLLAILALVLGNAYFVATEFALVAVRRTQVELWVRERPARRRRGGAAIERLDDAIAATQLGITLASIGLGFIGEPALARLLEPPLARARVERQGRRAPRRAIALSLRDHHLPARRGRRARAQGARARSARAAWRSRAPAPARSSAACSARSCADERRRQRARAAARREAARRGARVHSPEELSLLVIEAREAGRDPARHGAPARQRLPPRAQRSVRDVMVPRERVFAVDRAHAARRAARAAAREGYTRAARLRRQLDRVVGMLHTKDLFHLFARSDAVVLEDAHPPRRRAAAGAPVIGRAARSSGAARRTWRWCATRTARCSASSRSRTCSRRSSARSRTSTTAPAAGCGVRGGVACADALRRGAGRWRGLRAAGRVGPGWGCSPLVGWSPLWAFPHLHCDRMARRGPHGASRRRHPHPGPTHDSRFRKRKKSGRGALPQRWQRWRLTTPTNAALPQLRSLLNQPTFAC